MSISGHPPRPGSWLRPLDLVRRYGVSRQTIYEWRRRGVLPPARRLSPNLIGWPAEVIERWEAERPEAALR